MPQSTFVTKVARGQFEGLRERLGGGAFEFRSVPHAAFSVKGEGVVATLYESGKFVVQGADPEAFLARWTDLGVDGAAAAPAKKPKPGADDPVLDLEPPLTGSDEAGKGDYFGPLVVAAVRADEAGIQKLRDLGVADSKTLTDGRALKLGAILRDTVEHSIRRVDPNEYNALYPTYSALNAFLADLHAEVIRPLAHAGENVLVDQFERRGLVRAALSSAKVRLTEVPRAERHPVVAAASILARQEFLLGMKELSEDFGVALHKGAGAPVDAVGMALVRTQGEEALRGAAKLHFKNTDKILARA
ncbi:Ribonuclease HIII [Planctomycetes bacterium Poly30]|uniref:Ribonuclease HIII n=1 Tax=Saltatorellus ferox TaxID=2528018 RepID=A0A518F161_9BACT|nr:Ribonuclease HIII [Planctomycetes bacterium Poly30]